MNIKQLLHEDDGVSPVIGVILMVAITVILAAVIAAFVLGIGDTDDVAPQSSFATDSEEDLLIIELTSGDNIDLDDVEIRGAHDDWDSDVADAAECGEGNTLADCTSDDELNVGSSIEIDFDLTENTDVEANLVWTGDGEDIIYTIDETVPGSS